MIVTEFYLYIPDVFIISLGASFYVTKDYRTACKVQKITKSSIYTMLPDESAEFIWELVSHYESEAC